ncbi:MAG: hypothetical protein AB7H43_00415 [Acidimicrobiia bacterium]
MATTTSPIAGAVTAGPGTRAVRRRIEPGTLSLCTRCGERVRFVAREQGQQVIANVYVDGRWDRVEHYHDDCYTGLGDPYGAPQADTLRAPRAARPA